jgi:hypothetical protein
VARSAWIIQPAFKRRQWTEQGETAYLKGASCTASSDPGGGNFKGIIRYFYIAFR